MHLLRRIEGYLKTTGVAASRFGRDAVGDPGFVRSLRAGREPRAQMVRRIVAYIEREECRETEDAKG